LGARRGSAYWETIELASNSDRCKIARPWGRTERGNYLEKKTIEAHRYTKPGMNWKEVRVLKKGGKRQFRCGREMGRSDKGESVY